MSIDRNTLVVHGRCMHPFIADGASLCLEPVKIDQVTPGDVVAYIDDHGSTVAHRVIAIETKNNEITIVARGDATVRLEQVPAEAVIARVVSVEQDGLCYDLDSPLGRLVARTALSGGTRLRALRLAWRAGRRLKQCTAAFTRT